MLKYCLDRYKTQEICHKAVDAYLPLLKFVPHWFVTNMMLKDLYNAISLNGGIVFVNANSGNVTFFSNDVGLVNVDLINISLDDNNLDNDDPETIFYVRFIV